MNSQIKEKSFKLHPTHTGELYSTMKNNEIMSFAKKYVWDWR